MVSPNILYLMVSSTKRIMELWFIKLGLKQKRKSGASSTTSTRGKFVSLPIVIGAVATWVPSSDKLMPMKSSARGMSRS